jgi:hypothetical protein
MVDGSWKDAQALADQSGQVRERTAQSTLEGIAKRADLILVGAVVRVSPPRSA